MPEPIPILTVGDLTSELSRWSEETPVKFYSPLREQEFRFYRYRSGESVLILEINEFPETSPLALPEATVP
jgi:mRNA-degrading endonuclease RelE of RelBE toxin-antitoxin system